MLINTYEAAATLTLGVDALRNERMNVSSRRRVLRGVAVVGSTAINDCEIALYIEDFFVGNFRNTKGGAAVQVVANEDIFPVGPHAIPAGSKLSAIISVAVVANPLMIQLH
ncbi:unnamed protein product [marine sediment metagenome]|uniref:Uncharacterized protein n=1 Tax=marine sediment metagenome TaxID=412755 RepID=X1MY43_9ZZZZ